MPRTRFDKYKKRDLILEQIQGRVKCGDVLHRNSTTQNLEVIEMAEYHVGCGAFGIYAGTLNSKNKELWQNKTECTDEAINAVRDYMVSECLGGFDCKKYKTGGYEWTLKDGRVVELRVTIKDKEED